MRLGNYEFHSQEEADLIVIRKRLERDLKLTIEF